MLPRTITSILVATAATLLCHVAHASSLSLTTLYNRTHAAGGNMFDVTTFGSPVRITSLDIHTDDASVNRTLHVYTRPGTYAGNEGRDDSWTLHSLVPGITGEGQGKATPVNIHDLYLPAGTTTGLYVTYETGNLAYTSASATTYGGAADHLRLDLGVGVSYPFGAVYSPRIWNGTVYYDVLDAIPEPQPQSQIFIDAGQGVMFGPESKWNTIHATMAGVPFALYDPVGVPTGATATLSSGWTNTTTIGQTGAYAGTILAEATADYLYVTSENTSGTLTLEGLADAWYRVEMSASRSDSSNRLQNTTLNGAWADGDHTGQSFNAYTHGHQQGNILLWRARPIEGTLTLEVSRETPFGYLNALVVTQLPDPQPQIFIDAGNRNVFSAYDKWNTIHAGMSDTPIALYDADGVPTGVTLTLAGDWNNLTDAASQTGAYAMTHPILAEASLDNIWLGDSAEARAGTLTFDGLPRPESWQWYRVEMSAARSQEAMPRLQHVTIHGDWADGYDASTKFDAYQHGFLDGVVLRWDDVFPDENGQVTLTFATAAGEVGYLNALVITLVPEPSTALLLALGGLSLTFRRRRRKLHSRYEILHSVYGNAASGSKTLRQAKHEPRSVAMLRRVLHVAIVGAVALVLCTTHASAATYTLSTLWNTGTTPRAGGNMFDVTTFDAPIRVSGLDINTASTAGSKTLRVYTRPETYQGYEGSSAGWTLHSVIPAITGLGPGNHTHVDIHDLYLPAGTTTGLYVTLETMPSAIDGSLVYSSPGGSRTYVGEVNGTSVLRLDLGVGVEYPFGAVYSPRIWNGTVHYDVLDAIPEPQPQIFIHGGNGVAFGPDSKWNTIHAGLAGVPVAMHDAAGVPTGVTATLNQWTNSSTIGQTGEYANTHPVLAEATDDYMFVTGAGNTGSLTLEGLADTWYRVEMSASRNLGSNQVLQNTTLNGAWADGDHNGQGFNARSDGFDKGTVLLWRARPTDGTLTLEVSRANREAYLNALIVTQLPSEPQPQIFIDAGNAVVPGGKWNTIHAGMTGTSIALYDPVGVPTGVTATLAGNWTNSTATEQAGEYANTHPVLAEATDDFMWLGTSPTSVTLTLDGLMPESWQWYRVEMSASRSPGIYTRRQDVTLNGLWPDGPDHNGLNFDATNDGYLAGKVLSWDNVRPDEHGLITLQITRGSYDAYLNALVITLVPEPSTALLLALGGLSLTFRRRRRKLRSRYEIAAP